MEPINYNDCRIVGGIEAFADITNPVKVESHLGKIAVFPQHTAELPPGLIPEDEEDLLATA